MQYHKVVWVFFFSSRRQRSLKYSCSSVKCKQKCQWPTSSVRFAPAWLRCPLPSLFPPVRLSLHCSHFTNFTMTSTFLINYSSMWCFNLPFNPQGCWWGKEKASERYLFPQATYYQKELGTIQHSRKEKSIWKRPEVSFGLSPCLAFEDVTHLWVHLSLYCGDQIKCFLSESSINSTPRGLSDPYSLCSSGQAARWSHISTFFHFVFPALDIHGIIFCLADLKGNNRALEELIRELTVCGRNQHGKSVKNKKYISYQRGEKSMKGSFVSGFLTTAKNEQT